MYTNMGITPRSNTLAGISSRMELTQSSISFSLFRNNNNPVSHLLFIRFFKYLSNIWGNIYAGVKQAAEKLTFASEIRQISQEAEQESDKLTLRINLLVAKIQRFDHFICERPPLSELCQRYLREDAYLFSKILSDNIHFKVRELDPNDPLDRHLGLALKFNRLNYLWDIRLRFVRRHPILEAMLISYLQNTKSKAEKRGNLLGYK